MGSIQKPDHPNLLLATVIVFAFLYFPLLVLVLYSFNQSRLMVDWQGFTTLWYQILLRDSRLLDSGEQPLGSSLDGHHEPCLEFRLAWGWPRSGEARPASSRHSALIPRLSWRRICRLRTSSTTVDGQLW
jgi:hypothetical protein